MNKARSGQAGDGAPARGRAPVRRKAPFPGGDSPPPDGAPRLAMDRKPIAEIIAHGAESPDVEIGGVVLGHIGEDKHGEYVHVTASIRGERAREEGAHVTFTHETWNHIYAEMERHHRGLDIVGWYHTHPGFGVFLSEMDTFIHQNFFGQPYQVALVHDPLAGRTAIFSSRGNELVPLPRYWREGRAVELDRPGTHGSPGTRDEEPSRELEAIRSSLARLEMAVQQQRRGWFEDWILPVLLLVILLLLVFQIVLPPPASLLVTPEAADRLMGRDLVPRRGNSQRVPADSSRSVPEGRRPGDAGGETPR